MRALGSRGRALSSGRAAPMPVPAVANTTEPYGRLNPANLGGFLLISIGGPITSITLGTRTLGSDHFTTNGNEVVCSAVPTDAQYIWTGCTASNDQGASDPFTLTIDTEADTYSVSHGELQDIIDLADTAIDGKTIKGRRGADICGTSIGDTVTIPSGKTYTTGLTITSHDANNKCYMRRLDTRHDGSITFKDIGIRDFFKAGDVYGTTGIISMLPGVAKATFRFENVKAYSNDVTGLDLENPEILRIIAQSGGLPAAPDLTVLDSYFHDSNRAIIGTYDSVDIQRNKFDQNYADHISLGATGSETLIRVNDNLFLRGYGRGTDTFNPHVDCAQVNTNVSSSNSNAYEFIGNIVLQKDGRARDAQAIFLENVVSPHQIKAKIEHNIILTQARNGITVERAASGTIIAGNTLCFDQNDNGQAALTPFIQTTPDDEVTATIAYNIACSIGSTNASEIQNYEWGALESQNENADYSALLTGTDFDSDNISDQSALRTALTPDGNTTLWPTNRVRIGAMGGYYTYPTDQGGGPGAGTGTSGTSDAPWDETGWSPTFTDITDAELSTAQSNTQTVSGASSTGVEVWIEGSDGQTYDLLDTDDTVLLSNQAAGRANACLATNGQKIRAEVTSSSSNSTAINTTVHCGANTDTWTVTTKAAVTELLSDPGFDTPGDWTAPSPWSVTGGEAVLGSGGAFDVLRQTANVSVSGSTSYTATIDVTEITNDTGAFVLRVQEEVGGSTQHQTNVALSSLTAPETVTVNFTTGAGVSEVSYTIFVGDNSAELKVDNASLTAD